MNQHRARILLSFVSLSLIFPALAEALPGDAAAVIAHCGAPTADQKIAQTGLQSPERVLLYFQTALHFRPIGEDWSFVGASEQHVALSREALNKVMPCVGDALEEVAAKPVASSVGAVTIPDVAAGPLPSAGIPYSTLFPWFLFFLIAIVVGFAVRPYSRGHKVRPLPAPTRKYRKPSADRVTPARRRADIEMDLDESVPRGTLPTQDTKDRP